MELTINVLSTDFSTESPLVVTAGGISINGNSNIAGNSSHTVTVNDFGVAEVSINEDGYIPYNMTIDNVFNEDLSLEVILVELISDINNPNYLRPRPYYFTILDPCSFCVYYYYGSSNFGDTSFLVNNIEYKKGEKGIVSFASSGDYQLKVRTKSSGYHVDPVSGVPGCGCGGQGDVMSYDTITYSWDQQYANIFTGNTTSGSIDPIEDYLQLDLATNLVIEEYRVGISTKISTSSEPFVGESTTYYVREESITITPSIDINRGVNDDYTVYYEVFSPKGVSIVSLSQPFGAPIEPLEFELRELGVYNVEIKVVDNFCNLQYIENLQVETINFLKIDYVDCNEYEVSNLSSDRDIRYILTDVANSDFSQEGFINSLKSESLKLEDTSLYVLKIDYTDENDLPVSEEYVINNYCNIEACFASYIESIFCENKTDNPCPDSTVLNQMLLFYNTYFMKVNKFFQTNSFFTALETSDLDELLSLKSIMDKISSFCDRIGCVKGEGGAFNSYQAEGPYDFAGKGDNHKRNCGCSPKYYNNGSCQNCGK
jgi:hypothetical protein